MNAAEDERPEAVRRGEDGAVAWRAAVHALRTAEPDHADFYALAGLLVDTLGAVASLTQVLTAQVDGYGEGHLIYDDTRTVDPHERLIGASLELEAVSAGLSAVVSSANRFWSAIGHIGVEVTS